MNKIVAFVGHSFEQADIGVVQKFLDFFDHIKEMPIGFTWDHAQWAEPKLISEKVKEKMEGKNLFIGICTSKEQTTIPSNLKQAFINKNILKVNKLNLELKTSDWILQEIGFAVDRGMKIMLLLEEGVRKPGSLQGDLEYIPFNRNDLEKSFIIILEMLTSSLLPIVKETRPTERLTSEEPKNIEEKIKDEEAKLEPEKEVAEDLNIALFDATVAEDQEKIREIFHKLLEKAADENERIRLQARKLYWGHLFLKEDNLDKIKELQRANPKNSSANYYLGKIYEQFGEYGKAADSLIQAAENATDDRGKFFNYVNSAYLLAQDGDQVKADLFLEKAKALKESIEDAEAILLNEMARISLLRKEDENYLSFLEGSLDEKPNDHDNRFSLAYKYSEIGDDSYAVYHYEILAVQKPSEYVWNNLGASEYALELLGKGVKALRESEKLGATIAMGSIAFNFINAGFIEEAEEICGRAVKIPNFDVRVASAISRIKEVKAEEDKKLKELLENIKPRRSFYVKYAHACTKTNLPELSGTWRGPDCVLTVILKENNFVATGSYEETRGGGGWGFGSTLLSATLPPPTKVTISVKYSGKSIGYGIPYKLDFHEEGQLNTILTGFPMGTKEGLMLISDELDEIEVYEKGEKGTDKYYCLKKIS
ncbi:MAG: hypothetical protein WBW55_09425 [Desulfobaccales bacterium]